MFEPNKSCVFVVAACICASLVACSNREVDKLALDTSAPEQKAGNPKIDDGQAVNTTQQIQSAKQALSDRLGVGIDDIEVETARAVHWRSGAGGCPEPGMNYTMAIVPGMLIVLTANGKNYRYHAVNNRPPRYCHDDRAEAPAYGMGEEVM